MKATQKSFMVRHWHGSGWVLVFIRPRLDKGPLNDSWDLPRYSVGTCPELPKEAIENGLRKEFR